MVGDSIQASRAWSHLRKITYTGLLVALVTVSYSAPSMATPADRQLDTATIRIVSDTGLIRDTITVFMARSPRDRYIGLSDTDTLAPSRGMLFEYDTADKRTFVMRNMSFPIDILYFGPAGELRSIHHAPLRNATRRQEYTGNGKWILETNYNWTRRQNVSVGDHLRLNPQRSN